jgi:hypothetical protein
MASKCDMWYILISWWTFLLHFWNEWNLSSQIWCDYIFINPFRKLNSLSYSFQKCNKNVHQLINIYHISHFEAIINRLLICQNVTYQKTKCPFKRFLFWFCDISKFHSGVQSNSQDCRPPVDNTAIYNSPWIVSLCLYIPRVCLYYGNDTDMLSYDYHSK